MSDTIKELEQLCFIRTKTVPDTVTGVMKSLRISTGMTQKQVAAKAGVTTRHYSTWETGAQVPPRKAQMALVGVYLFEHYAGLISAGRQLGRSNNLLASIR